MLYYWKINKKSFYGFLVISFVVFLISLFYIKNSTQSLATQLAYNLLISFGILMSLYLILFFASFHKFRKLTRIFSKYPFDSLPNEVYKVQETGPLYVLFLASLTIKGTSNDYPVRIEYKNGQAIIVVGIQTGSNRLKSILNTQGLSLNDLGVIKTLRINSLLNNRDTFKLSDEIEKITDFLHKNDVPKY